MKTLRMLFLFGVFSLVANSQSHAAPLLLPAAPSGAADLYIGAPTDVTYSSGSQAFQVSGYLSAYSGGAGEALFQYGDAFTLTATISSAGMLTAGTLNIMGDMGYGDVTLLAGSLESGLSGATWGYDNNGSVDQFSFLFTVQSGGDATVTSDFGGIGTVAGINLYADFSANSGNSGHDTPFTGTWGGNFNNLKNGQAGTGQGYADVFPVPEPSSIVLLSAGFLCMMARRRLKALRS